MTTYMTMLFTAALFCVGFGSIASAYIGSIPSENFSGGIEQKFGGADKEMGFSLPSMPPGNGSVKTDLLPQRIIYPASAGVKSKSKSNRSPPVTLVPELIDILSPEMFSQLDPVSYFLKKTIDFPPKKLRTIIGNWIDFEFTNRGQIPPHYFPYTNLLSDLLRCQEYLENLKQAIIKMQNTSDTAPPLSADLFPPELSGLFSSDVLSDDRPLFRFIIKLTNIPKDKICGLWRTLNNIRKRNQVPKAYEGYVDELLKFFLNQVMLLRLEASASRARDVVAKKLSNSDGLRLNSIHSGIPSTNLPLSAAMRFPGA